MTRLLLVEDEEDLSYALTLRLKHEGFACETAGNGKEGLIKARELLPDLIITDLLMSGGDGYELCQELSADKLTASIPVLVLTAISPHTLNRRSGEVIGNGPYLPKQVRVLHKPFASNTLMKIVREMIAGKSDGGESDGE